MIKLNTDFSINKFDLINNGNMGFHGESKYILEIEKKCQYKSCLFFTYLYEYGKPKYEGNGQTNKKILNYVFDNYEKVGELENIAFEMYSNKKE